MALRAIFTQFFVISYPTVNYQLKCSATNWFGPSYKELQRRSKKNNRKRGIGSIFYCMEWSNIRCTSTSSSSISYQNDTTDCYTKCNFLFTPYFFFPLEVTVKILTHLQ